MASLSLAILLFTSKLKPSKGSETLGGVTRNLKISLVEFLHLLYLET